MKQVIFPPCRGTEAASLPPAAFYLSAEEYLARNSGDDFLMIWRVGPTVIFGRNQDMDSEVNVPYCTAHGVRMFRRKSGGGCVYADEGNIMISHITSGYDKAFIFSSFISSIALSLRKAGFDAWPSGRNDIIVDGKKVSGSAFYSIGKRNIVHATLMCGVDMDVMQEAITPPVEKLASKGIASVRQRVANLSEFGPADTYEMEKRLADFFCDGKTVLSAEDVLKIGGIMKKYLDDKFITKHPSKWKH